MYATAAFRRSRVHMHPSNSTHRLGIVQSASSLSHPPPRLPTDLVYALHPFTPLTETQLAHKNGSRRLRLVGLAVTTMPLLPVPNDLEATDDLTNAEETKNLSGDDTGAERMTNPRLGHCESLPFCISDAKYRTYVGPEFRTHGRAMTCQAACAPECCGI